MLLQLFQMKLPICQIPILLFLTKGEDQPFLYFRDF
jgi:hypothetical protein